ncbi:MAG TPA: cobalamin-independent methionine synthase II family protein [Candidatus Binataceae bacterium]|jgi:5-methyltetrahydropteroyltriglutamate--homocysteine methyltransferase|nr:cobalamin-independent methionine synthase II family protein [Candidatus Binataceae bacterium]
MRRSTDRILTTHTGSLPRPDDLTDMLYAREAGELRARAALDTRVRSAVAEVVRRQAEAGIDVVNDGEMGKIGYSTYVKDRLSGFGDEEHKRASLTAADMAEFPEFTQRAFAGRKMPAMRRPSCNGPIAYRGGAELERDLDNLRAALAEVKVAEAFVSAASPGVIAQFLGNYHYPTHEAYIAALADAMKSEYDAIHRAGFLLQLDCPDLAMSRHIQFADASTAEFRKVAELHVEALNHALRDVAPDRVRLHLCWGNYEGPHHRDIALAEIIDIVLKARPMAISYEAANPRHEHEFKVFESARLPPGKILIPGVLDSTTNFIEHPEVVAMRICNLTRIVGRENVIAGTDCGFATFAGFSRVVPAIAWAKLRAMAEGARLASRALWN